MDLHRTCSPFVVAMLLTTTVACNANDSSRETFSLDSLVKQFAYYYLAEEFSNAAGLFHCPEYFTPAELEADRAGLAESLEIMTRLYGPLRSTSPAHGGVWFGPTTSCGTAGYWKHYPLEETRIIRTEQRESESGYLIFQFSRIDGASVLFQFGHGLRADHPEARSRARRFIAEKLKKKW